MAELLTISDVSRRSGVASSALRFYEDRGLIGSERAGSGHRRYPRAVLRRIAFIVFAQKIGLTLEEIGAELAQIPANRPPDRSDWARISSRWTRRVDERIAELAAAAGQSDRLHRLRLPVAEPVPALQSRRPGGQAAGRVRGTGLGTSGRGDRAARVVASTYLKPAVQFRTMWIGGGVESSDMFTRNRCPSGPGM